MNFKCALVLSLQFLFLSEYAIAKKSCAKTQIDHFIEMLKSGAQVDSYLSDFSVEQLEAIKNTQLNYNRALEFCQILGSEINELKEFWPSNTVKYTVHSYDSNEKLNRIVADAYSRMSHRLDDFFGFSFASSINVVFADNKNDMYQLAKPFVDVINIHYMNKQFFNQYDSWCDKNIAASGIVLGDLMLICINPAIRDISNIEAGLIEAVAHEFFHIAQIEMAGFAVLKRPETNFLDTAGPAWLLEGSAVAFARKDFDGSLLGITEKSLGNQPKNTSYDFDGDYSVFEKYDYFGSHSDDFYAVSERMVNYLTSKYGQQNLLQFYSYIGHDVTWKMAFYDAFGISVDNFYKQLNAELKDSGL